MILHSLLVRTQDRAEIESTSCSAILLLSCTLICICDQVSSCASRWIHVITCPRLAFKILASCDELLWKKNLFSRCSVLDRTSYMLNTAFFFFLFYKNKYKTRPQINPTTHICGLLPCAKMVS